MKISVRGWIAIGSFIVLLVALATAGAPWLAAADEAAAPGQLTEQSLGNLLQAIGLEPKKVEQRYDFAFKALLNKEEWELSMTAVLSQDGGSIWVIAWLDELPRSAADVPRTALLRLLAENDRLGNGKAFAYVASNRRFVLQRVVPNRNLTTAAFREILTDLGGSVVETYPHWAVENWKGTTNVAETNAAPSESTGKPAAGADAPQPGNAPTRAAINDPKFRDSVRK